MQLSQRNENARTHDKSRTRAKKTLYVFALGLKPNLPELIN